MEKNKDLLFIKYNVGYIDNEMIRKVIERIRINIQTEYINKYYETFILPVRDEKTEIFVIPANLNITSDILNKEYENKIERLTTAFEEYTESIKNNL